jgi:dihydroxyacetone kinase-like protein
MTQNSVALSSSIVRVLAETAVANERYFGELDAVVGDGDFGYSLARGFEALLDSWAELDRSAPGAFLRHVATVVTSRMGGTSGPIWGTAFLRAAAVADAKTELTGVDVVAMLQAAIEGVKQRGNSEVGDKTLLDSLVPAVAAYAGSVQEGCRPTEAVQALATEARGAADRTRDLQARRGRASYAGERSIGSVDPGAVAVAVLAEALAEAWDDLALTIPEGETA